MKTYLAYISVETPIDDRTFKMIVVAHSTEQAADLAKLGFPELEPLMTPQNACRFSVAKVDEYNENSLGQVLACHQIIES